MAAAMRAASYLFMAMLNVNGVLTSSERPVWMVISGLVIIWVLCLGAMVEVRMLVQGEIDRRQTH